MRSPYTDLTESLSTRLTPIMVFDCLKSSVSIIFMSFSTASTAIVFGDELMVVSFGSISFAK